MRVCFVLFLFAATLGCASGSHPEPSIVSVETASTPVPPEQLVAEASDQGTDDTASEEKDPTVLVDMTAPVAVLLPPLSLESPASVSNRYAAGPVWLDKSATGSPVENPSASPGLSRRDVANVIGGHIDALAACYDTGLEANPNAAGRIEFAWTVNPDGTVRDVRVVTSALDDATTEKCMTRAIESWRFPEPQGGPAVITFPFKFSPIRK